MLISDLHDKNVQCEAAWVLVHLVFIAEVVPVHSVRLLTRVENSRVLWRRVRWYRHWWRCWEIPWWRDMHRRVRGSGCRLRWNWNCHWVSVRCLVENEVRVERVVVSVALEVVLVVVKHDVFRQADLAIHSLAIIPYDVVLLKLHGRERVSDHVCWV
jgi:hypothetical protein